MAIFITGAGGFLGQALVNTLVGQGKEVLAFDFAKPKDEVLAKWGARVKFCQGDIKDTKLIADLTAQSGTSDPIIHLAGILTARCDKEPQSAIEINIGGLYNVLDASLKNGKRRVLFASTISVYGRGLPQPITEDMPLEADGWYGVSKQAAEQVGLMYARRYGLDFRAVRFAAVTGPNRVAIGSASLFTSLIAEKAARGEHYDIEVTPDTSYPVVYITDAVDALIKLMNAPEAKSRIYNISSGNVVVDKMVASVKKIIPDASFSFKPDEGIMAVVSGFREWTIGCARAEKEIGWRPSYTVDKMVNDIIEKTRPRQ